MRFISVAAMGLALVLLPALAHGAADCVAPSKNQTIKLPGRPFAAVASADECWIFVSLLQGHPGSVAVLRNRRGSFVLVHTVKLKRPAAGEALSSDGRVLAVAGGSGVMVLDTAKLERNASDPQLGFFRTGSEPIYIALGANNGVLFVSEEKAQLIGVFGLAKARRDAFKGSHFIGNIPTGGGPVGLAFSPNGKWLFATVQVALDEMDLPKTCKPEFKRERKHAQGVLMQINAKLAATHPRDAVVATVPAGCNPVRVAVSPSGKSLWVTARGSGQLLQFNAQNIHSKPKRYSVGTSPVGVAVVRPDGKQVWVADSARFGPGKSRLVGLRKAPDGAFGKPVSVAVSGFPRELNFLPDGRDLVTTLTNARKIKIIVAPVQTGQIGQNAAQ
ncbi:MAG: YncE family protein [Gammaproteobacteria bacterium]